MAFELPGYSPVMTSPASHKMNRSIFFPNADRVPEMAPRIKADKPATAIESLNVSPFKTTTTNANNPATQKPITNLLIGRSGRSSRRFIGRPTTVDMPKVVTPFKQLIGSENHRATRGMDGRWPVMPNVMPGVGQ